ncbi:MAG: hypothetical protein N2B06_14665, partial [Clostridium sp.]
ESRRIVNNNEIIDLVGYSNTPYFKMEKILVNDSITLRAEDCFYGIYILSGNGKLITSSSETPILSNDQYFVSSICNDFEIKAESTTMEIVRFWGQDLM